MKLYTLNPNRKIIKRLLQMWLHHWSSKALFFEEKFSCIRPYMQCLFRFFFPPFFCLDPHEWEQKLDLQTCLSAGFFWEMEHFKTELFQVVGLSLLVQLRLVVRDSLLCGCLRWGKRKVSSYISSVRISHPTKQACQCKEVPLQPTVHCLFTWTIVIVSQALPPSVHKDLQSLEVIWLFQLPAASFCLHLCIIVTSVFHIQGLIW